MKRVMTLAMLVLALVMVSGCATFDLLLKDNLCLQADVESTDGTMMGSVQVCGGETLKAALTRVFGKATGMVVKQRGKDLCEKGECPVLIEGPAAPAAAADPVTTPTSSGTPAPVVPTSDLTPVTATP